MVQLFLRMWLEANVFFGHVPDKDGLGIHHLALGDLDLSFSVNLHFLAMMRNTLIETVEFLWLRVLEQGKDTRLGINLVMGVCLMLSQWKTSELVSVIILSFSGCWGLHHCTHLPKALSRENAEHPSIVRIWAAAHPSGKNEGTPVNAWRAEWTSPPGYSSQMLLQWAPWGGTTEDCLSSIFTGRVCLLL